MVDTGKGQKEDEESAKSQHLGVPTLRVSSIKPDLDTFGLETHELTLTKTKWKIYSRLLQTTWKFKTSKLKRWFV